MAAAAAWADIAAAVLPGNKRLRMLGQMSRRIGRLIHQAEPAFFAAKRTYRAYSSDFSIILLFSCLAAFLQTAGLGLIYYLLVIFEAKAAESSPLPMFLENLMMSSPLVLTILCVVLLSMGVRIRYAMFARTGQISQKSGVYAGQSALVGARRLVMGDVRGAQYTRQSRYLAVTLLKDIPLACGFAARSFASIAIHLVQVTVLVAVLFYLAPLLTLAVLLIFGVFATFIATAYENALELADDRKRGAVEFRREITDISAAISDPHQSEAEFTDLVNRALTTGGAGSQLSLRLSQRQERQTGSLIVEYAYPIAIIGATLVYLYAAEFAPTVTRIALYFLLIRQALASLYLIGNIFMSFSKHHSGLSAFFEILGKDRLPSESVLDDDALIEIDNA